MGGRYRCYSGVDWSLKQRALLEKKTVGALSETKQNQLRYARNLLCLSRNAFVDPHQRKQLILSTALRLSYRHTEYSCKAFAISLRWLSPAKVRLSVTRSHLEPAPAKQLHPAFSSPLADRLMTQICNTISDRILFCLASSAAAAIVPRRAKCSFCLGNNQEVLRSLGLGYSTSWCRRQITC